MRVGIVCEESGDGERRVGMVGRRVGVVREESGDGEEESRGGEGGEWGW